MKIAQEKDIFDILGELIDMNRQKGVGVKYLDFLKAIHVNVYTDSGFREALESLLHIYCKGIPTIVQVENTLANMEGAIRPLFVAKGIVEPMVGKEG